MTALVLDDVQGGFQSAAAVNENYRKIEAAVNDSLSRSGSGYNIMQSNLDMGGNNIYNWANPIVATAFNWMGPWTAGWTYKIGDVIETGSISYIAIEDHTASMSFLNDISKWQLVAGASYPNVVSLRWKGEWAPATEYLIGDVVKANNNNWISLEEHTSGLEFTGLEWDEMATIEPLPDHELGDGDVLITQGAIVKWGRVTANNIIANELSAITTSTGTLQVATGGWIRGGQTDFNTGTGFWQGYHMGTYKVSFGNSTNGFTWDGSALTINGGTINIVGGSININNRFTVSSSGAVSISSASSGARTEITNSLVQVYDGSGVLRVRMGVWT